MKRARTTKGASLTGGTGDFNPQTYSITIGNNGVDGRNTAGFPTPIPRFGSTETTSPVMEILKVYFVVDDLTAMSAQTRPEEHTSELTSLMRISYADFCLKKKKIEVIN